MGISQATDVEAMAAASGWVGDDYSTASHLREQEPPPPQQPVQWGSVSMSQRPGEHRGVSHHQHHTSLDLSRSSLHPAGPGPAPGQLGRSSCVSVASLGAQSRGR